MLGVRADLMSALTIVRYQRRDQRQWWQRHRQRLYRQCRTLTTGLSLAVCPESTTPFTGAADVVVEIAANPMPPAAITARSTVRISSS